MGISRKILIFFVFLALAISSFGQGQNPEEARNFMALVEEILSGTAASDQARDMAVQAAELDTTLQKLTSTPVNSICALSIDSLLKNIS